MSSALRKLKRSYIGLLKENGKKPILKNNIDSNLHLSNKVKYPMTSKN